MGKTRGIITGSIVITMVIGILNSIYKYDKLPSFRFFAGNGILFLFLSGLAEWEDEVAKAIALAIVTFTLLGEGGGVLDHFLGKGQAQTTLDTTPKNAVGPGSRHPALTAQVPRHRGALPGPSVPPGFAGLKPVIPNGTVIHQF